MSFSHNNSGCNENAPKSAFLPYVGVGGSPARATISRNYAPTDPNKYAGLVALPENRRTAQWQELSLQVAVDEDLAAHNRERRSRQRTESDHEQDAHHAALRARHAEEVETHATRREAMHRQAGRCRIAAYGVAVLVLNLLPLTFPFLSSEWSVRAVYLAATGIAPLLIFRIGVPSEYEALDADSGDRAFRAARGALGLTFGLLIGISLAALLRHARLG